MNKYFTKSIFKKSLLCPTIVYYIDKKDFSIINKADKRTDIIRQ